MRRLLTLFAPVVMLVACAEPSPFTITIENDTAETVGFDQVYGDPVVQLFVSYGGAERAVLEPHGGCYRRCGRFNEQVCADMAAPEEGAYALLAGEALEDEHDGMGWIEDTDAAGECDREIALTGIVSAELVYGFGLADEYSGDPVDPTESGFVDEATFDPAGTATGELDLAAETELMLVIAP